MSTDRYKAPTEPDQDAYEDAWYRALKAKATRRSGEPKESATFASGAAGPLSRPR